MAWALIYAGLIQKSSSFDKSEHSLFERCQARSWILGHIPQEAWKQL